MPKPACPKCGLFYRPKKNGFYIMEGMPKGTSTASGLAAAEHWEPYKIWVGDLWECRGCGAEVVVGYAGTRVAEHYEPNFQEVLQKSGADKHPIYDC